LEEVQVLLKPFADRRIKVDVVQSDSAALLDFFMHEHPLAAVKHNDRSTDPIGVLAMLDIGTDSSNIVMTNGRMLAMRSIPLGGNDFTRALVNKYNLDWRQAEKLKRNPTSAPLLHQTYEALQPCFQNLYAEVHRSIDQFITLDRRHVVQRLFVRGGGLKLHGLLKYFWLGR
jgi:type IV pilus assembly protein PilM